MADEIETRAAAPAAGWRASVMRIVNFPLVTMLIALALVVALQVGVALIGRALVPVPAREWAGGAVPVLVTVIAAFFLYKLVIRHLGERKHDDLAGHGAGRQMWQGALLGALLIAAAVAVAAILGVYRVANWEMGSDFAMIFFQAGIAAGFMEELVFRGILFRWIEEFGGSWAALALTSAFFGLAHANNEGATVLSTVAIAFEAGILLGAAYMLFRSLWAPMAIHFAWNVTQGFIFDVPVSGHPVEGLVEAQLVGPEWLSGGAFGLEASVIALVICTSAGVWMLRRAIQAGQLMPPRWVRLKDQTKL